MRSQVGKGGGNSISTGPAKEKLGVHEELGEDQVAEAWWAWGQCRGEVGGAGRCLLSRLQWAQYRVLIMIQGQWGATEGF